VSQILALTEANSDERVTLAALFTEFLKVSLCSFGGGLVWARRSVVDQVHWMSEHEFADTLSLIQFLPGPNVIGIAVCVGAKLRGAIGALAALSGFVVIPCAMGFALGALYLQSANFPLVQNILGGVSAVAAGLLIATGVRLLMPHLGRPVAVLFAALAFAGIAFTGAPLFVVLLGLAPLSIAAAAVETGRAR
jgi:chromate transporter